MFGVISVVVPEMNGAAVNLNGIKKLLANDLITFFIKDKSLFINGVRSLPRNPSDCIILET